MTIHRRVFPGRRRVCRADAESKDFGAGCDRLADEAMQRTGSGRARCLRVASRSTTRGAREQAIDDALVVFHRGALRHRQGDDPRAPGVKLVDPQHAIRKYRSAPRDPRAPSNPRARPGGESGQPWGGAEPDRARSEGNIVRDDGAKRKDSKGRRRHRRGRRVRTARPASGKRARAGGARNFPRMRWRKIDESGPASAPSNCNSPSPAQPMKAHSSRSILQSIARKIPESVVYGYYLVAT